MDPDATDLHGSPVMGAGAIPWVDALMLSSSVSYAARRAVASRLRVKPVNTPKRRGRWPNPAVVRNIGPVGHPEPHKGAPYGSPLMRYFAGTDDALALQRVYRSLAHPRPLHEMCHLRWPWLGWQGHAILVFLFKTPEIPPVPGTLNVKSLVHGRK